MPDHYEIIGVPRDASLAEIRIAYRRSAQILHPDRFETASDAVRDEAQRRMRQLNAAMESIEAERAHEDVSGTGRIGSVALGHGRRGPLTAPRATPPAPAPAAAEPVPTPPERVAEPVARAAAASPPSATTTAPASPEAPAPLRPPALVTAGPADALEIPLSDLPPPPAMREPAPPAPSAFVADSFDDLPPEVALADELERPRTLTRERRRSVGRGTLLAGLAIAAALVAFVAYVSLSGSDSGSGEAVFSDSEAPFTFSYPQGFTDRTASLGEGVARNRPSFQVALGPRPRNLTLVAAYDLTFTVADDGTATGPAGEQITADELDQNVDAAMKQIADAADMQAVGTVQSGSLGPLRARIYEYAKPGNELHSTFVVAFDQKQQFFVSCQRTPDAAAEIDEACALIQETFEPVD